MVVIVVSVAIRGPGVEDSLKGDPDMRWTVLEAGFFEAIGVISFAFVVSPLPTLCPLAIWDRAELLPFLYSVTTTLSSSTVPSELPLSIDSPKSPTSRQSCPS